MKKGCTNKKKRGSFQGATGSWKRNWRRSGTWDHKKVGGIWEINDHKSRATRGGGMTKKRDVGRKKPSVKGDEQTGFGGKDART